MRSRQWAPIMLILVGLIAWTGTAASSEGPLIEPAYYNGDEIGLLVPSGSSNNPNQVVSACFYLGPGHRSSEPTSTLYALFVPGATQFSCQDGSRLHLSLVAPSPTAVRFDFARHRRTLNLDRNYVRLNEFPEWFTVDENTPYRLSQAGDASPALVRLGSELIAGVTLAPGDWVIEPLSTSDARPKHH